MSWRSAVDEGLHSDIAARRHAQDRLDLPHSLADHGRSADDVWEHAAGHCGYPDVEHAGLVARVQAARNGAAVVASPQVRPPPYRLQRGVVADTLVFSSEHPPVKYLVWWPVCGLAAAWLRQKWDLAYKLCGWKLSADKTSVQGAGAGSCIRGAAKIVSGGGKELRGQVWRGMASLQEPGGLSCGRGAGPAVPQRSKLCEAGPANA